MCQPLSGPWRPGPARPGPAANRLQLAFADPSIRSASPSGSPAAIAIDPKLQIVRNKGWSHRLQFFSMTVSRSRQAIAAPDVEAAVAAVRQRGLRLSAARRGVIEALFASDGPVS